MEDAKAYRDSLKTSSKPEKKAKLYRDGRPRANGSEGESAGANSTCVSFPQPTPTTRNQLK